MKEHQLNEVAEGEERKCGPCGKQLKPRPLQSERSNAEKGGTSKAEAGHDSTFSSQRNQNDNGAAQSEATTESNNEKPIQRPETKNAGEAVAEKQSEATTESNNEKPIQRPETKNAGEAVAQKHSEATTESNNEKPIQRPEAKNAGEAVAQKQKVRKFVLLKKRKQPNKTKKLKEDQSNTAGGYPAEHSSTERGSQTLLENMQPIESAQPPRKQPNKTKKPEGDQWNTAGGYPVEHRGSKTQFLENIQPIESPQLFTENGLQPGESEQLIQSDQVSTIGENKVMHDPFTKMSKIQFPESCNPVEGSYISVAIASQPNKSGKLKEKQEASEDQTKREKSCVEHVDMSENTRPEGSEIDENNFIQDNGESQVVEGTQISFDEAYNTNSDDEIDDNNNTNSYDETDDNNTQAILKGKGKAEDRPPESRTWGTVRQLLHEGR